MLKDESGLQLLVSLLLDKQQTVTDEDKEKKVKKEKGAKEAAVAGAKTHEGLSLFCITNENMKTVH